MLIKDVEISFADYLAYQHWFQRTDHQAKWTNRLIDCLGALLAGLGLIIIILGRPIGWFFLGFGGVYIWFYRWLRDHRTKQSYQAAANAQLFAARVVQIDETGITTTMANTRGHIDWSGYQRVVEEPRLFILMIAKRQAQLLPKSGLTSAQIAELRNWFSQCLTAEQWEGQHDN